MSGRIRSLEKLDVLRGVPLFLLMLFGIASPSLAGRAICDSDGNCVEHSAAPRPDFGSDPQHPNRLGGGGGAVFSLWDQEPYRNSDTGPLGVVLSTGEFQITATDMEIPGRGIPFRLSRTYRSRRDGERSLLGHNWQLNYDETLTPGVYDDHGTPCDAVQWRMGNGFTDIWVDQCQLGLGWKAFVGFFGKIRPLGAGRGYQIRHADGTVKTFAQEGRNPENQVIWLLTRIEDRNGNALAIHHAQDQRGIDSVTDSLGRSIAFAYTPEGRLKSVTDFTGRSVVYTYDERGDLVAVRSPLVTGTPNGNDYPAGKTTTYHYLGADGCAEEPLRHNLRSIRDARGQVFLTNGYSSSVDPLCGTPGAPADVVTSQVYGAGTLTYAYASVPSGPSPTANVIATQATVTDRNGNLQVHSFNPQGNPTSVVHRTNRSVRSVSGADEIDYVETNTYVDNGGGDQPMLVSRHTSSGGINVDVSGSLVPYSEGMTEDLVYYDQQGLLANPDPFQKGNVLQIIRTPGPRGAPAGQPQLVTAYVYEPLFNQPISVTDPRGHETRMSYDYQEGTYTQLTAGAIPTPLNPAWWSNSEIAQFMAGAGNSGLGDINGDGYHRGGNLIKMTEGVAIDYAGAPQSPGTGDEIASYTAYNGFGLPTRIRDAEYNETLYRYFSENDSDGDGNPTPAPEDGRTLSAVTGEGGGGYLQEKVLDATPALPLPPGLPANPREGGQNPPPRNVLLSFTYDPAGNLKSATDGRGVRTGYAVNALNQIVQITHAATASSETPAAPAFAYLEQFRYDENNNVVQHRTERRDDGAFASPSPRRWIIKDMTYDVLDHRISETVSTDDAQPIRLTTTYSYDANGNLRKTVFPAGNAILRFYDERDLLYREVVKSRLSPDPEDMACDPAADSVTQYDYDGAGNLIQLTDPEGHTARTGYDGYDRQVVGFDPAFQKRTRTLDAGGNVLEQISFGTLGGPTPMPVNPPVTGYPELSRQLFYYDELGRVRRTDTRLFKYEGALLVPLAGDSNAGLTTVPVCAGRPAGECDPLPGRGDGWVTSLVAYDRLGRVVKTVDDNGHAAETRYDGLGRKVKVILNVVSPFTFDPANPLDHRNAVDYAYDANGNLTQILETEFGADRSGGAPRLLPAQQHLSTFSYDSMNRPIEAKLVGRVGAPSVNLVTASVYDSRGNRVQVTDPAGGRTKSIFDGLDRLTKTEAGYVWNGSSESIAANLVNAANPDGKITTVYAYDANGRLTSIRDDNNRVTSFTFDPLNRQTRITYPDSSYRQVSYDRDSLARSWTNCSNTGGCLMVAAQFDWLHRMTRRIVDNSQAPWVIGARQQAFEYDGSGRITLAQEDLDLSDRFVDSEVALTYNSTGKVISEAQTWRDDSSGQLLTGTDRVRSDYDGVGFRTSVAYPDDRTVGYLPDELSRPRSIVDSYSGAIQYDYLGAGRLLNRIYPNGTRLTMLSGASDDVGAGYDNARRLVDFAGKLTSSGADLVRFAYGYDAAGNRTFERRVHEISGPNWKGETFGYDAVNRLISRREGNLDAAGVLQGSAATTQEFTLDGLGNWKSHKKNASTYNQSINLLNQYTLFNGPAGQRTLNYDFLGNLTSESQASADLQYAYDFLNRLVLHLDAGGNVITYRYDALGRRIAKTLNGVTQTRFVYDGDKLIQERDGIAAGRLVASYVYGAGSEEVLTRRRWSGGIPADLFYHTNALGSVAAVTSSSGAVVERYKYDAYGQVTFLSPAFTPLTGSAVYNNVLFAGRYYDTESRLYYHRARTYHPYLGRFLQRDPLGEAASLNLYNYVFNNPVNSTDPTGMLTGYAAQEWDRMYGDSDRAYRQRMAQDAESTRKADEATAEQGTNMRAQYEGTVNAAYRENYEKWQNQRQERRLEKLQAELDASAKDPDNMKSMEDPQGVDVNVLGFGQNAAGERSGAMNKSELDEQGSEEAQAGKVTFTLTARYLMKPGKFGEPSEKALELVADAVQAVTNKGCGEMPVEINGFSLGSGPAVGLTNALTGSGYNMKGGNITLNLIDPYMADGFNTINNSDVHINDYRGTEWDSASIGVNWGAHLMGVGNRAVLQGSGRELVNAMLIQVGHTQMDSYVPGALGTAAFLGY